jgi:hypothetical protein
MSAGGPGRVAAKPAAAMPKGRAPAGGRPATAVRPGGARVNPLGIVLVLAFSAAVLGLSAPSFMILVTGMAPTAISYFFESGNARRALPCMVALNIAGVAPVLNILWGRGGSISAAYGLLRDPFMWLLMYGAAGAAYGLIWIMPRVVQAVLDANARSRRADLVKEQEKLLEEWGADVATASALPQPKKPTTKS